MVKSKDRVSSTGLTSSEIKLLKALKSPEGVQGFLDRTSYNTKPIYLSPREVLRHKRAHCMDGALFAAAALEQLGFRPQVMDLRARRDDDHVIAVYKQHGRYGAVSASNFSGLRFREPAYKSLRELAMSFFELYFNVAREKTLREYSVLLDLRRFNYLNWRVDSKQLDDLVAALDSSRHFNLISPAIERGLCRVDERSLQAGLLGAAKAGLYKPK